MQDGSPTSSSDGGFYVKSSMCTCLYEVMVKHRHFELHVGFWLMHSNDVCSIEATLKLNVCSC